MVGKPSTLSKQSLSKSCNGLMSGSPTHKINLTNQISPPKLSDVDHEVPNDPEQALDPSSYVWLQLNMQLKLYNLCYYMY